MCINWIKCTVQGLSISGKVLYTLRMYLPCRCCITCAGTGIRDRTSEGASTFPEVTPCLVYT